MTCTCTPMSTCAECAERMQKEPQEDFLAQIEACRREVAQWPEWMIQERTVPEWMAKHATDL